MMNGRRRPMYLAYFSGSRSDQDPIKGAEYLRECRHMHALNSNAQLPALRRQQYIEPPALQREPSHNTGRGSETCDLPHDCADLPASCEDEGFVLRAPRRAVGLSCF